MNDERPPKQCRLICEGMIYSDGKTVEVDHTLEWRGEMIRRANPEKDDQWKLVTQRGASVWVNRSDIEILGKTPGIHTFREMVDNMGDENLPEFPL